MADTIIKVVLDKSGSMESVRSATISGYNEFLGDQKKLPDPCLWGITLFDTDYHHQAFKPIADVEPLSQKTYVPGGNTALLDAVANAISEVDALDPTGKVIFLILTDGEENSSKETKLYQVHDLIEARQKAGWQFVFIGANQDAFAQGMAMGVYAATITSVPANTGAAVGSTYTTISKSTSSYRSGAASKMTTPNTINSDGSVTP